MPPRSAATKSNGDLVPAQAVTWRALAASARGASHVRAGLANQDAMLVDVQAGCAVAAVADGHGGARHFRSADGSLMAVQAAREALLSMVPSFVSHVGPQRAQLAALEVPQRIVSRWVELVRADLEQRPIDPAELAAVAVSEGEEAAAGVRADPLLAYGATLLAALAVAECLVLVQLGDGDVLLVDAAGHTTRPVPRDERLLGNLTTSICRVGAEQDFRTMVLEDAAARPALLLLSTDGYANSFRSDDDYLKVGSDFLALLRRHGAAAVEQQLPGILEHASTHGSGDDITLAMLVGEVQAGVTPAVPLRSRERDESSGTAALAQAQRRIERQRRFIIALAVALVGVIGWTQRHRLPALGDVASPPAAESTGVVRVPSAAGVDSGLAPEPSVSAPAAAASASILVGGKPRSSGASAPAKNAGG